MITRRDSLKGIAATALFAPAVLGAQRSAYAASLPKLPALSADDVLLLVPGDRRFAQYEPAFNARTMLAPQLRALCKSARAVSAMVDWCRSNTLPFAVRSGGHSFEGLSESASVVIDTRLMNAVAIDASARQVSVGAGASLGTIYRATGAHDFAIPAGSCPTVGIGGHALGGGIGYLMRPFGLACDCLEAVELVDAQGNIVEAGPQQHPDLFWASRGGGGGSFGIVTRFRLRLQTVRHVVVFSMTWKLPVDRAAKLLRAWQAWAPHAPDVIGAPFMMYQDGTEIFISCFGQTIGSESELRRELKPLVDMEKSSDVQFKALNFLGAVDHAARQEWGWKYHSAYSKGKSDYITSPLGEDGAAVLAEAVLRAGGVTVVCEPYGGAVAKVAAEDSAFSHRAGTLYCIQYAATWEDPTETPAWMERARTLYAAMRPYASGAAYVNYCDLDLPDFADAYWGANLPRLKKIKAQIDPDNVFRHAQSIPVGA